MAELRNECTEVLSASRTAKASVKECSESLGAQKALLRKTVDEMHRRHETYDQAFGSFAEALRVPNPIASALSMAAAAV